ncbi:MAG TPA: hypothetical protein VFA03_03600 [Acetobacteraceae bacterium]|nr:hypothetical protein [Acetobacteraceae bacterium]
MDLAAFEASLQDDAPPASAGRALAALWWARKGDWNRAHAEAQADDSAAGAAVHAFLHRMEGDLANAAYWYRRAGRPAATSALDVEWAGLAEELVAAAPHRP